MLLSSFHPNSPPRGEKLVWRARLASISLAYFRLLVPSQKNEETKQTNHIHRAWWHFGRACIWLVSLSFCFTIMEPHWLQFSVVMIYLYSCVCVCVCVFVSVCLCAHDCVCVCTWLWDGVTGCCCTMFVKCLPLSCFLHCHVLLLCEHDRGNCTHSTTYTWCVCACMHACVCACIHACVCVCMRACVLCTVTVPVTVLDPLH